MDPKVAIIEGSARSNGDTRILSNYLMADRPHWELFDLNALQVGHYDYQYRNQNDDFFPTIHRLLDFPVWLMVSPIYWYTVSSRMKAFIDRISDLLDDPNKDLGRALRGKSMASLSCSRGADMVRGFEMPLRETANYLGMQYLGHFHGWVDDRGIAPNALPILDGLQKSLGG